MTPKRRSGRASEEGFTLLETLVEVLLVSLALGVLAFLAATTFDAWKRISAAAEQRAARELFFAALDQVASRVQVPFYENPDWGQRLEPAEPGRPLLVPWYRGNPDALLELGTDGTTVWLRTWDADFSMALAGAGWRPLNAGGRVVGVLLEEGGRSHPVRFSSVPLPALPGP